jgi:uncharacterized repeat protein (TIGR03837 family)
MSNQSPCGQPPRCDIFCTVIDNFGDIGVCWRLARQLAAEHNWCVRLWVDDLHAFARLCPQLDAQLARQQVDAVEIRHWCSDWTEAGDADCTHIVIEAFACELPEPYLLKMAAHADAGRAPVWINLEYLSAEDWVAAFHLQPSPHPRYPLRKTFFFPGLRPGSGGVLRERGLAEARRRWLESATGVARLWASLGIAAPPAGATVVSLFGYENPALAALLAAWRDGPETLVCMVPQGRVSADVGRFFGLDTVKPGGTAQAGALTVHAIPFTEQSAYDKLLWACDLNFVRGEDSFVRAQWAERPFVWQIYPQMDAAHQPKLDAALARYEATLPAPAREALNAFWQAWNAGDAAGLDWPGFWLHRQALAERARTWSAELAALGDLAGNLAEYVENQLK